MKRLLVPGEAAEVWRAACSRRSQAGLVTGRGRLPRPGRVCADTDPGSPLCVASCLSEWLVGPEGSPGLCVLGASEKGAKASGLQERFQTS